MWHFEFSRWNPGVFSVLFQEVASLLRVRMWDGFLAPGSRSASSFFLLSCVCLGLFEDPKLPTCSHVLVGGASGGVGRPQHSCPPFLCHAGRSPFPGETYRRGRLDLILTLLSSSGRHSSSVSPDFKDIFQISLGSSVGAGFSEQGNRPLHGSALFISSQALLSPLSVFVTSLRNP